ncbi:hypothetical protein M405DRAFT_409134 [Rhizopogon salebrosus TDB-379]|nr:hypothetical protein M405DRAFT_409134 [Rhizopogon salebrosus TDB-379]
MHQEPHVEDSCFFTCCVSVQDTGGYEGHIFTGPHRLPTRDERYSRETLTAADAHDDGAGRLRLLRHCWIVLRSAVILCHVRSLKSVDKEAADCAKPWNDLRESISFVLRNPGRGTYGALSVATTQLHGLALSYRRHVRGSVKKDPLDACFGKLHKDKILMVVVARERRSRIMYVSHLRD